MVVDCVARVPNDAAKEGLSLSWFGSVILLENVHFHVEEEETGVDKDGNKIKADAEASKDFQSSFAKVMSSAVTRSALHTLRTARDFLEVYDERKDEATRCDVMTEEVLVPQGEHLIHGGVSDRFRQSSGRLRLVCSPLWRFEASYVSALKIIGPA